MFLYCMYINISINTYSLFAIYNIMKIKKFPFVKIVFNTDINNLITN